MNKISRTSTLGLLALALILLGINGYAQSHEAAEHDTEEHGHLHNHHLGLFVGATSKFEEGGTYLSMGLEYEYLLDKEHGRWKLGVVGEFIFAHETEYLVAVPIIYNAYKGLYVLAGPGLEWSPHHEEVEDGPCPVVGVGHYIDIMCLIHSIYWIVISKPGGGRYICREQQMLLVR